MTHGSVAKSVRLRKERHPEQYCAFKDCLWRLKRGTVCPKHLRQLSSEMEVVNLSTPPVILDDLVLNA